LRRRVWQRRVDLAEIEVRPNRGHEAVFGLVGQGRLHALVTQNIDGLHAAAGHDEVIEVHGNNTWASCLGCRDRRPMADHIERVRAGDPDPHCELCGGIVKSDAVLFQQALDPDVIAGSFAAAEECDILLAIGSTLGVIPAAYVVDRARAAGKPVVISNGGPTERSTCASPTSLRASAARAQR